MRSDDDEVDDDDTEA